MSLFVVMVYIIVAFLACIPLMYAFDDDDLEFVAIGAMIWPLTLLVFIGIGLGFALIKFGKFGKELIEKEVSRIKEERKNEAK